MLAASFVAPFTDPCGLGQPFLRVRTVSPPAPAALRRMLSAPPCHSRSFSEKKRSRIGLFMSTAANLHTGPDTSQPFVSQIRHVQLGTAGILSQRLSDLGISLSQQASSAISLRANAMSSADVAPDSTRATRTDAKRAEGKGYASRQERSSLAFAGTDVGYADARCCKRCGPTRSSTPRHCSLIQNLSRSGMECGPAKVCCWRLRTLLACGS
eukprot:3020508-Rhodomonas_salina.1